MKKINFLVNLQKYNKKLIGATLLFILFALTVYLNGFLVYAKTPPYHSPSRPKPDNLILHLPWRSASSHLNYNVYGDGLHTTPKDYFAIDFSLNGAMVHPTAPGRVIYSADRDDGYGKTVIIEHTPGFPGYVSIYAHLENRLVSAGDNVTLATEIGREGITGTTTQHLHFAVWYCTNTSIGNFPSGCEAVVPEPILGQEVYEGLDWWHILNPLKLLYDQQHNPRDADLPVGSWGSNATADGANIKYGDPIVYHVNYSDPSGIKEVRLTAYYPNWPILDKYLPGFNEGQVWRIIARCKPIPLGIISCGEQEWSLPWFPHNDTGFPIRNWLTQNYLDVPWLPKANNPFNLNNDVEICISFDIFDKTGNARYAPGDPRCNINQNMGQNLGENAPTGNEARLVRIQSISSSLPRSNYASYISDITLPDRYEAYPGESLVKTWRIRNTGTTTWGSGYQLAFVSGNQMGHQAASTYLIPWLRVKRLTSLPT
jgi:hypothetical protein